MTENHYEDAIDNVSREYGCEWNDHSKLTLMARFMQEQKVDFEAWENFLRNQAEEEQGMGDEDYLDDLDEEMDEEETDAALEEEDDG